MCAIDALGITPMLEQPIQVNSSDPISGGEVHVQLAPGEQPTWQPAEAVVLAGSTCCDRPSFGGCCDVLNFFETLENAQRYLHEHPEITGTPISIPEAAEAGRIVSARCSRGTDGARAAAAAAQPARLHVRLRRGLLVPPHHARPGVPVVVPGTLVRHPAQERD
ncbi:MAG: organomercurial lyase, partial [Gaiellaceae bacterium]